MPAPLDRLDLWQRVTAGDAETERLLADVAAADVADPAVLARLRRGRDADLVAVAIELVRARHKAATKFPDPGRLVCDTAGVEQATSHVTAEHKTRRYRAAGVTEVTDLCCGIGGDAMSLSRVAAVTGVDRSPVRAWMAGRNAGCATSVADVEEMTLPAGAVFHLDPARRRGLRRTWRYTDYEPGPAFIDRLLERHPGGAIKLGPGVDFADLPLRSDREVELISESGTLVQAVLWCGRLAAHAGLRTATRLPDGVSFTAPPRGEGDPRRTQSAFPPAASGPGRHLFVPDPAIERAGLLPALLATLPSLAELHPGLGILTADGLPDSPWLTPFEVRAWMPWRTAKVRAWLTEHDAGVIEVKTRGRAVDADAAAAALRGRGDKTYTVLGLRLGRRVVAVICRRLIEGD